MRVINYIKGKTRELLCKHQWRFKYKPSSPIEHTEVYCIKCGKEDFKRPDMILINSEDMQAWCPICEHELVSARRINLGRDVYEVKCSGCGGYSTWKLNEDGSMYTCKC